MTKGLRDHILLKAFEGGSVSLVMELKKLMGIDVGGIVHLVYQTNVLTVLEGISL